MLKRRIKEKLQSEQGTSIIFWIAAFSGGIHSKRGNTGGCCDRCENSGIRPDI